ncbi:MAG: ABC transporter ATP-binding protein [Vicinamibacterales bacterium]
MLALKETTRTFGPRVAVDRVSLEVRAGDVLVLLGPNGAGKTTLLRLMSALLAPTRGEVVFRGTPVAAEGRVFPAASGLRARCGLLTESPGLWERLSVRDNLLTYARLHRLGDPEKAVDTELERFGMTDRAGDRANALSRGMKQKVALARTFLHAPDLVLLDEPTTGLDPAMSREVRARVRALRDDGRAVVVATHNLDEAERMATTIAIVRSSIIVAGAPDTLRRTWFQSKVVIRLDPAGSTRTVEHYADVLAGRLGVAVSARDDGALAVTTDAASSRVPEIVRTLVTEGAAIVEVAMERPALEDVYLQFVDEPSALEGAGR